MRQIIKKRISRIFYFTGFASVLGGMCGLISGILDGDQTYDFIIVGILAGICIGFCMSYLEEFQWRKLSRVLPYWPFTLLRLIVNVFLIIFWLIIILAVDHMMHDDVSFIKGVSIYLQEDALVRDIVLASLVSVVVTEGRKISRLHSVSEWVSLFTGRYFYPKEEDRIVLFADIVDSTALAEKLGPMLYSQMVSDIFKGVSEAILTYHGEVYQHVGDGVIVTWLLRDKNDLQKPVDCYELMLDLLKERSAFYQENP